MFPPSFASLPDNPFVRLRRLLDGVAPGAEIIDLSIGEPQHAVPGFVAPILASETHLFSKYPPTDGTPEFRRAVAGWLERRFGIGPGVLDADRSILPVNGTREALFLAAQLAPERLADPRPVVLMPNPFYQTYAGAALAIGAEPVYVAAPRERNFLPDYAALDETVLGRTVAAYICSPSNPQGSVADLAYWRALLSLARKHGFLLLSDECYADIYDLQAPPSLLDAAAETGSLENVLVFHSLSKRSNLAGLRSGFVAGSARLIDDFRRLRLYGGAPSPLPVLSVAAQAWRDDAHAEANRLLYREKLDIAARIFGQRLGFYRPPGGFFLWLDVADSGLTGEEAALRLWSQGGVRVLPGAYLSRPDAAALGGSHDPGTSFLRLALVHDAQTTEKALKRVNHLL